MLGDMSKVILKAQSNNAGDLLISGISEMRDFLRKHSDKKMLVTVETIGKRKSEKLLGYWYGKVLPDMQEGYKQKGDWKTENDIENDMLSRCPFTQFTHVEDKVLISRPLSMRHLDNDQLMMLVSFTRLFAQENLHVFIHDPKTI